MKLIPLTILLISLAVDIKAQKFRQEQFPFPPKFQTPNSGIFSSDSTLYLPPESHTPIPYFPIKNVNNLNFPYLPPTGTKAPNSYPTPFPLMMSSSFVPNFDDDDDDDEDRMIRLSTSQPAPQKINRTEQNTSAPVKEKRDMRPIPKYGNHLQQPIDRIDVKFPMKFQVPVSNPTPSSQSPASRRMIITTESHGADMNIDQLKAAASFQANQYLPAPGSIFISSTTEPAIPILRLFNEMDLDGSFSYEALGADQTHYVQHSHMENMGSDKEEQVVEGSYSYVGDNGQTYTVHYIADSNGFRASGDHLPVAPPIPEIIQRSIQYNLAEEAKRPQHLKSWQDEQNSNDLGESHKNNHFAVPPPPPRNLFTGRTPEAFSYSYSQGSNTANNLVTAASSQAPVKTVEYTTEPPKVKPNNGPISPQITFLASQGAHVPSMNTVQNTIARMFTTEKSNMPQLINYEAAVKEADQESNKALWRWQYGLNANNINQNSNKDTISRSFGEGDDVMINFGDMTPEQYSNMIRSQLEPNSENIVSNHFTQSQQVNENQQYNENQQLNQYQQINHNQQISQNQQITQNQQINQNQQLNQYQQLNPNQQINQNQQLNQNPQLNPNQQFNQNQHFDQNKQFNQNQQFSQNKQYEENQQHTGNLQYNNVNNDYSMINEGQQPSSLPAPDATTAQLQAAQQQADWFRQAYNSNYNQYFETTVKPVESHDVTAEITQPKLITQKDFAFPSHTVTQSYDYDEHFYEPRKIKALNTDSEMKMNSNNLNGIPVKKYEKNVTPMWPNQEITENEVKGTSTLEPPFVSSLSNLKFTDFIMHDNKDNFKPFVTSTEAPRIVETTTTEKNEEVGDIFETNLFLKNFFKPSKPERKNENQIKAEPKKVFQPKFEPEPKAEKTPKFIQYQSKPNEVNTYKKKPVDISEVLNFVSMKSQFESNKVKSKSKPTGYNIDHKNDMRFIPVQQEINEESPVKTSDHNANSYRPLNQEQQDELRGIIKNYKILQRNNMHINKHDNSNELRRDLSPPPLKTPGLPPLGRAGPSMKSYLPPIFV